VLPASETSLRLLRGESIDAVSRQVAVEVTMKPVATANETPSWSA
jgi:hypothetical protein